MKYAFFLLGFFIFGALRQSVDDCDDCDDDEYDDESSGPYNPSGFCSEEKQSAIILNVNGNKSECVCVCFCLCMRLDLLRINAMPFNICAKSQNCIFLFFSHRTEKFDMESSLRLADM